MSDYDVLTRPGYLQELNNGVWSLGGGETSVVSYALRRMDNEEVLSCVGSTACSFKTMVYQLAHTMKGRTNYE